MSNAINTEYSWFEASESNKNWNCKRVERAEAPSDHTELIGVNLNFVSQTYVNMAEYKNYVKSNFSNFILRCNQAEGVRPAFYLNNNVGFSSGTGKKTEPYEI